MTLLPIMERPRAEAAGSETNRARNALNEGPAEPKRHREMRNSPRIVYEMPGHLIRRCHQISIALFHQECAAFEITPQQYAVLRVLATHDGVDQITVAGLAAFNRTTAGELVARLEQMGLLTRQDGSDDRRVKNLFITKAGRRLLKDIHAGVHRVQERLLEPLEQGTAAAVHREPRPNCGSEQRVEPGAFAASSCRKGSRGSGRCVIAASRRLGLPG